MKNIKKKTKVFIGTLVIISTFFIGSVLGSEVLLVFKGTSTIDKTKELIQELIQDRNTIIDEYNELDSTATEKIKSLEEDINSKEVNNKSLTDEIARKDNELKEKDRLLEQKDEGLKGRDKRITDLENELTKANNKCNELQDVIDSIELKEFNKSKLVED